MSSPLLHAKPAASPAAGHKRYGQFAESSSRTVVGLQKANIQLQKEMEKLERQAQTAVNNIANHQQAMKMSWRRLEQKRKGESPTATAQGRGNKSPAVRKAMLSSNTTKLHVQATPEIYGTGDGDGDASTSGNELPSTHSDPHLLPPPTLRQHTLASSVKSSPYISPFAVRKVRTPQPSNVSLTALTAQRQAVQFQRAQTTIPGVKPHSPPSSGRPRRHSNEELKLPHIESSSSQPALVASTSTVDKDTLLQASALMGLDDPSRAPDSFRNFYSNLGSEQLQAIALSTQPGEQASTSAGTATSKLEGDPTGSTEDGELSLAEQFEQIRHCRYIRHYRPDGTAIEEFY